MSNITSLTDFEYQKKIDLAVLQEIAKGRDPRDLSGEEQNRLAEGVYASLSPKAREKAAYDAVFHRVQMVMGERIAEKLWPTGKGWWPTSVEVKAIGKELNFADQDEAVECFLEFRQNIVDIRFQELGEWRTLGRFAPLFLGQPETASLGEAAAFKAARGDKLAMSFLAWKEIQ